MKNDQKFYYFKKYNFLHGDEKNIERIFMNMTQECSKNK